MKFGTVFPARTLPPGYLAWFVKSYLEGCALGIQPALWSKLWQLPPLYRSGVRYSLEPGHGSGVEDFALPPDVLRRGVGDCDDLVIWRLAELWQRYHPTVLPGLIAAGTVPHCIAEWQFGELHVLIRMPDGSTEDPSALLGMK